MNDEQRNQSFHGLPAKTLWTVIWFVVLGGAALFVNYIIRDSDVFDDTETVVSLPGPLPKTPSRLPEPEEVVEETMLQPQDAGTVEPRTAFKPIDDPGGRAMCPFYRALSLLNTKQENQKNKAVRILHYGDSILTTDELSGRVRRILQKQFGDAGHGFVLLGKPWRWYHHLDVQHGARGKWRVRPLTSDPVKDGIYGLGGVAFETRNRASAWAATVEEGPIGTDVTSFDVSYLRQPRGGSFEVIIDEEVVRTVSTNASQREGVHQVFRVSGEDGAKLTVKTLGDGPVRMFGAVLENGQAGVVYDSLAINGARASVLGRFNDEHWRAEMRRRDASLVILMFGANEGHNEWLVLDKYRSHLGDLLDTVKANLPEAACLVVGPLDQADRQGNGKMGSRRMPKKLSETQREVALDKGCAFFDTYEAMGGTNSMARWFRNGLGGGDLIHPTEHGARRIGSWLADALLAGYERFVYDGEQCELNVTTL